MTTGKLGFRYWRLLAVVLTASLTGCGFTPVYGTKSNPQGALVVELAQIALPEAGNRQNQQLRNELQFQLHRASGASTTPAYRLETNYRVINTNLAIDRQTSTSSQITLNGVLDIILIEIQSGEVLLRSRRTAQASYESSSQSYANSRALIDAKGRLSKTLAQDVAQVLGAYFASRRLN